MSTQFDQSEATYRRDSSRFLWFIPLLVPGAIFLLLPVLIVLDYFGLQNISQLFAWTGPVVLYLVLPLADWFFGRHRRIAPGSTGGISEEDRFYRYIVWFYLPLQYGSLIIGAVLFTAPDLSQYGFHGALSTSAKIGLALSMGVVGAVGINAGHEMAHQRGTFERWISKLAFAPTWYGHFYVEHNKGHHINVATPEDPASARLGESLWKFVPRSVVGSLRSAWRLEAARMKRLGVGTWNFRNEILIGWAASLVFWSVCLLVFGRGLLPFIVIQAIYGVILLESVNYLEHYGLLRQRSANGRYERCKAEHSWNSDFLVTNLILFNLMRHSDHHANPTRRYQSLRSTPEAPQLPGGYPLMMLLANFPPLWRKVMDPRVIHHYGGDVQRANIQPGRRVARLAHRTAESGVHA